MFIHEFGNRDDPTVILLAPMMVSGTDLYALMSPHFNGTALCRNAGFAEWFMRNMFRSRKKKLTKTHVEASGSLVKMYGYDFAKMMTKSFERITPEDIDAICHACCHYDLRKLTDDEQCRLNLDFGEKDFDWRYSKKTIPTYMPKAEVAVRPGYAHCGYMAAEPEEYVKQLEQFMRSVRTV